MIKEDKKRGLVRLLYGEDTFRSHERLKYYTEAFRKQFDPNNFSVFHFYAPDFEILELHRAVSSPPLFAPKRLFVIHNFSKIKLEKGGSAQDGSRPAGEDIVFADIKNLKDNSIIFLEEMDEKALKSNAFYKKIKLESAEYFPQLKGIYLEKEIGRRFEKEGYRIELPALRKFLSLVGNDFWKINSEMEKLINYVNSFKRRSVILRDVETTVSPEAADNCFALLDYLSQKDKKNVIKGVEYLKKSDISPETIFYQIGSHFRHILEVKSLTEKGKINSSVVSDSLDIHPYRAGKLLQSSSNFTLEELKKIHDLILEIDFKIKTGQLKPDLALDLLVIDLLGCQI